MTDASRSDQGEPANPFDRLAQKFQDVHTSDAELDEVELAPFVGDDTKVPLGLERLGDFDLIERLGKGGMGAVYLARQRSLGDRLVAVKVIRPDFAWDAARIARFRGEAMAASKVAHPGIVTVLHIGEQHGLHYIAQELVPGGRTLGDLIHERRNAPPKDHHREMVELFVKIADALEAVHAAKVIHRDIKPGNILITPQGEPKVADFGLAKDLEGVNPLTSGDTPGTAPYKSPEHIDKKIGRVDARSDVFSLGVTFYEALTFVRPFVGDEFQVYANILHKEVDDLRTVYASVPRELSIICRKCLEKEPRRRYHSMAEFTADLRRYVGNEPIHAQPPSVARRAQLWAQRNRVGSALIAASVVVAAISSAAILTISVQNVELEAQKTLAQDEAARANQQAEEAKRNAEETALVAEFQSQMLSDLSVDEFGHTMMVELHKDLRQNMERIGRGPEEIEQTTASVAEALRMANPTNVAQRLLEASIFEPAVRSLEKEYADKRLLAASIQTPLAGALYSVGLFELGEQAARRAVTTQRATLGEGHSNTLVSVNSLALLVAAQGRFGEAEQLLRQCLDRCRATLGHEHLDTINTMNSLGMLLQDQGRLAEAEAFFRDNLALCRAQLGAESLETHNAISNLAGLLRLEGQYAEAESLSREALNRSRLALGDKHPDTLTSANNLGALLRDEGKLGEAESLLREAMDGFRIALGDNHPKTLSSITNFARFLQDQGDLIEAERLYRVALESRRAVLGDHHPETLAAANNLAVLLMDQDELDEAEQLLQEALEVQRALLGGNHPDVLTTMNNLALLLQDKGNLTDAEPLLRTVLKGRRESLGSDHPEAVAAMNNLAVLLQDKGQFDEAEPLLRWVLADQQKSLGSAHFYTIASANNLAVLLRIRGKLAEAEPLAREAMAGFRKTLGGEHADTLAAINNLAVLLLAQARLEEAEPLFSEALAGRRTILGDGHRDTQKTVRSLLSLYESWHATSPNAGHDQRAAELRRMLRE